jgi:SAM-dependent methyltransferase
MATSTTIVQMNPRSSRRDFLLVCAKVQTVNPKNKHDAQAKKARRLLPGLSVKDGFTAHPFDANFNVRTSGLVAGRYLKSDHRHDRHATAYYGVAPSVFHALVKRWQRSRPVAPLEETTFVDLGAGMGRAVLLASELGFKAVDGVELHPTLARIARKNASLWRAAGRERGPVRIVHGDAVEFALPPGPLLVFLFNPFGAPVLRRLLKRWRKALAVPSTLAVPANGLDLLYVNNEQEGELEAAPGWTRLFLGKVPRSRADAIADHKIMANQPEGEYASSNWEDCSIWRHTAWASRHSAESVKPGGSVDHRKHHLTRQGCKEDASSPGSR